MLSPLWVSWWLHCAKITQSLVKTMDASPLGLLRSTLSQSIFRNFGPGLVFLRRSSKRCWRPHNHLLRKSTTKLGDPSWNDMCRNNSIPCNFHSLAYLQKRLDMELGLSLLKGQVYTQTFSSCIPKQVNRTARCSQCHAYIQSPNCSVGP